MNRKFQVQFMAAGMLLLILLVAVIFYKGMKRSDQQTMQTEGAQTEDSAGDTEASKAEEIPETQKADRQDEALHVVVPGSNPEIRVQICSGGYESGFHSKITLTCTSSYTVSYGDTREEHTAQEPVWLTPEDPWLSEGEVTLTPADEKGQFVIQDLVRDQANPTYSGYFRIRNTEQGLLVINCLPMETYLCSVVPSEMPSSYPLEALKAQAVCARTYALKQIQAAKEEGREMDVDDSVSFQVYNNIGRNEKTDEAVAETAGKVMMQGDELVDALYYSTSCGIDLTQDLSEEAVFCAFMTGGQKAYEKEEPWYRWSTYYSAEELTRLAQNNFGEEVGNVQGLTVLQRSENGAIAQLQIEGEKGSTVVEGEYSIRKFLQTANAQVTLQDGSAAPNLGMLPSAFFYLTPEYEGEALKGYTLTGGGYGHGNGMSQNGAKHMAEDGKSCEDILNYYYGNVKLRFTS
ncbi:MAG: SpoIID/LytB domain-containing protein [Lachnospiraceae bacterium]|nr:SpoIID/LytB domain-containing protein [Lachnospiraceae bacterium]